MSETIRWSSPVTTSTVFTEEQAQRVQALRAAREVIELRIGAKGPFTPAGVSANATHLLEVAQWIMDGKVPSE